VRRPGGRARLHHPGLIPTVDVYHILFYGTAALIFAATVAAEIYRLVGGRRGRVRALVCGDGFGFGEGRAQVELADGRVVEAAVPGCTQCMCRLRPGDAVVVTQSRGRWLVGPGVS